MPHPTLTPSATKDYRLNAYADGFGKWHCEILFTTPMGNTNMAHAILVNAIRHAKRTIRAEIVERMAPAPTRHLRYEVTANKLTAQNQITYLRVSEKY
jgi:ribosome-binding factor A